MEDKPKDSCEILQTKFIKNFNEDGDREFATIKSLEECVAWQLKYTSYFSKKICLELAELNWQRICENQEKINNIKKNLS